MAHAARIEDGIVREVIVVPSDLDATESDAAIEAYIHGIGLQGKWIRTSYNNSIRGCYAGIGFTYDSENDVFVAPAVAEEAVEEEVAAE
jgi:hypothetical protein